MSERIVVVGAGIVGVCTALELTRLGYRPVVLEASTVGAGVSGGSLAAISRHLVGPLDELPFVLDAVDRWEALAAEIRDDLGLDVELDRVGQVRLVERGVDEEAELARVAGLVEAERAEGLDVEMIGRERIAALLPLLDVDAVAGASWCPTDAKLNALVACRAIAIAAARRGAQLRLGERAVALSPGPQWTVGTDRARIEADAIVVAAGPWSHFVLAPLAPAIASALVPQKAQCCATERLPPLIRPVVGSVSVGISTGYTQLHQTRHGEVLFNTVVEAADPRLPDGDLDATVDAHFLAASTRTLARLFPQLAQVRLLRSWAACEAWTPDRRFLAGAIPGHDGLFVAAGDSGTGFLRAPMLGSAIARLVAGASGDAELAPYRPARDSLARAAA